MPIGDVSRFYQADVVLFVGLLDTGNAAGAALAAWRLEQDPAGAYGGRDFTDGELPDVTKIAAKDCPAFAIEHVGIVTPTDMTVDAEKALSISRVFGVLRQPARDREIQQRQKLQKFAELTWSVLVYWRSLAFNSLFLAAFPGQPNPINRVLVGPLMFPTFEESETVVFEIHVGFVLDLPVR